MGMIVLAKTSAEEQKKKEAYYGKGEKKAKAVKK